MLRTEYSREAKLGRATLIFFNRVKILTIHLHFARQGPTRCGTVLVGRVREPVAEHSRGMGIGWPWCFSSQL